MNQHLFYGDRRFLLASERWRKGSLCYYSGRLNHSHHLRRPQTGDITKMTRLAFMYSSAEDDYDYDHSNYYQRYRLQEIVRAAAALSEPQGLGLCSYCSFDGSDTRGYHTMEVPGTGTKRREMSSIAHTCNFSHPLSSYQHQEETTQKHLAYMRYWSWLVFHCLCSPFPQTIFPKAMWRRSE